MQTFKNAKDAFVMLGQAIPTPLSFTEKTNSTPVRSADTRVSGAPRVSILNCVPYQILKQLHQ
jgi:hypothetical protein